MITRLTIKNFKKISFLDIHPTGNVVEITGRNSSGKTSVTDGIWTLLLGKSKAGDCPIKEGANTAELTLETEDYRAERKFRKNLHGKTVTELHVWLKDGQMINRPQEFLSGLMGDAYYDPSDFLRAKPEERVEMLKKALSFDFTDLEDEVTRIHSERHEKGKEERLVEGELRAYSDVPDSVTPVRPRDEIIADISKIDSLFEKERDSKNLMEKDRAKIKALTAKTFNIGKDRDLANTEIAKLEQRKNTLLLNIERLDTEEKLAIEELEAMQSEVKTGYVVSEGDKAMKVALMAELQKNHESERMVERRKQRDRLKERYLSLQRERQELTREKDALLQKRRDVLANAELPIKGLSFGERDILINGLPLSNASASEQIKVAASINMKMDSDLKIMRILDGSLLDNKGLEDIKKFADENGVNVWIETVLRDKSQNCLILSDGQVQQ